MNTSSPSSSAERQAGIPSDEIPSAETREAAIRRAASPLPGSTPYDNLRPISVPQRCDAMLVIEWLAAMHTHYTLDQWKADIDLGRLMHDGNSYSQIDRVFAGQRFEHLIPDMVEPDVNANVRVMHEDESLLIVNKPAPLPIHPCGRFNRNTLTHILRLALNDDTQYRIVHRLDAGTTGVVVLCKTRTAAAELSAQFKAGTVKKSYLARVEGSPSTDSFSCNQPISSKPGKFGTRKVDEAGSHARTGFEVIRRFDDDSTLLRAIPITGRTNQIRIHLQQLGLPICGDQVYDTSTLTNSTRENKTAFLDGPRLCLHAYSIAFRHPHHGNEYKFVADAPEWAGNELQTKL